MIITIDMVSLFVVGIFTNAFWIMLTVVGMAGATFAILKERREDAKTKSHLS